MRYEQEKLERWKSLVEKERKEEKEYGGLGSFASVFLSLNKVPYKIKLALHNI